MHVIRNGVSVCNRFFENIKNSSEQHTKNRRVRCPINPLSNPRHFSSAPPSTAEDKTKRMHLSPLGEMLRLHEGKNNCKLAKTDRLIQNQAFISIILFPHKVYSDRQRAPNDLFKVRCFAPILYRNGKTIHRIVFLVSTDNSRKCVCGNTR